MGYLLKSNKNSLAASQLQIANSHQAGSATCTVCEVMRLTLKAFLIHEVERFEFKVLCFTKVPVPLLSLGDQHIYRILLFFFVVGDITER
jgi:hypothetical protein